MPHHPIACIILDIEIHVNQFTPVLISERYAPLADHQPTAMVQWVFSCLIFILLAIIEYAWILYHKFRISVKVTATNEQSAEQGGQKTQTYIDKTMIKIFPGLFLIFSTVFWSYTAAGQWD